VTTSEATILIDNVEEKNKTPDLIVAPRTKQEDDSSTAANEQVLIDNFEEKNKTPDLIVAPRTKQEDDSSTAANEQVAESTEIEIEVWLLVHSYAIRS
jgi:phosphoribosylaminoimidazole-succinocarboxamide synthase